MGDMYSKLWFMNDIFWGVFGMPFKILDFSTFMSLESKLFFCFKFRHAVETDVFFGECKLAKSRTYR